MIGSVRAEGSKQAMPRTDLYSGTSLLIHLIYVIIVVLRRYVSFESHIDSSQSQLGKAAIRFLTYNLLPK